MCQAGGIGGALRRRPAGVRRLGGGGRRRCSGLRVPRRSRCARVPGCVAVWLACLQGQQQRILRSSRVEAALGSPRPAPLPAAGPAAVLMLPSRVGPVACSLLARLLPVRLQPGCLMSSVQKRKLRGGAMRRMLWQWSSRMGTRQRHSRLTRHRVDNPAAAAATPARHAHLLCSTRQPPRRRRRCRTSGRPTGPGSRPGAQAAAAAGGKSSDPSSALVS